MSSMFKKKGGLAFKPRIPSARPRAAAPGASSSATSAAAPTPPPPASTPASVSTSEPAIVTEDDPPVDSQPRAPSPGPLTTPVTNPPPTHSPASEPQPATTRKSPPPLIGRQLTKEEIAAEMPNFTYAALMARSIAAENGGPPMPGPRVYRIPPRPTMRVPISALLISDPPSSPPVTSAAEPPEEASPKGDDYVATHSSEDATPRPTTEESQTEEPLPTPAATSTEPTISSPETPVETPAGTNAEPAQPPGEAPRPKRLKRARKPKQDTPNSEEAAKPKKRQRKAPQDGEASAPKKPRKRKEPNSESQQRARRGRSVTPEDSENQLVDLQTLKMSDLTKDLHIGRKFSRHDELRERERRKKRMSRAKLSQNDDTATEASYTPEESQKEAKKDSPTPPAPANGPAPASGPQFRIVDGQIVVDQSSLVMDRHARDAAGQGDMEVVEENDFTRLITSNSFMNPSKLQGPNLWTDDETELFYRGLRMFGTDFEIISKMFPRKQRRHIKLKFNREERHAPRRINAALIGEKTTKMDLNEYQTITGSDFEPVEVIEARQRKRQEDFEAEQKRIADEQAEQMRKKREELFADEDDGKKKKGKKKRQTVVYGLNGEPITTEGQE